MNDELKTALNIIGWCLGDTEDTLLEGLPGGTNSNWGYDEELIIEIGEACKKWSARRKFSIPQD